MRPVLVLVVALSACGPSAPPPPPPTAAEQACARGINDDPAVREMIAKSAEPDWLWQNAGKVDIVKQQAMARCLQGRGALVRGGVERQR